MQRAHRRDEGYPLILVAELLENRGKGFRVPRDRKVGELVHGLPARGGNLRKLSLNQKG